MKSIKLLHFGRNTEFDTSSLSKFVGSCVSEGPGVCCVMFYDSIFHIEGPHCNNHPVASRSGGEETWHLLATSFDAT